jgi:hypothetical protein
MMLDCPKMIKSPDPTLLSYLASYDPHVARLALAVREMVLEEAPEAIESISKGYAVAIGFSFPLKDGFCHIAIYSSYVNLGFNRGALLADPKRLLAGTGKLSRHIAIRNENDLNRPLVRHYLQAAIEQINPPTQDGLDQTSRAAPGGAGRSRPC